MKQRILSVDIFRGLTIALMILVNTPGTWRAIYAPFRHAEWDGYTPTDLVFPFFLFIVGTSIVFAYRNKQPSAATYKKIGVRVLKLIALGIFLGAFTIQWPFFDPFEEIRFPGVLQRIGVVFGIAALLFLHLNWKALVGVAVALLLGYWVWMGFIPLDGQAPTLERAANNWANYIDLNVFGSHMYKDDYDPEGLLSTLPAIVTSLLGIFTGLLLVSEKAQKVRKMLLMGVGLLVAGTLWDLVFPINKALWSSSFVLVTAGWANLVLGGIYYLTDVKGVQFGSIFRYAGSNAITLYFLSSFVSSLMHQIQVGDGQSVHGWLFDTVYAHNGMPLELSSLLYALSVMGFYLLLGWWLYKKEIFIKV
ncbi:heparan-alpha-glucosaminide N-acetyltransferase domain-containing protein [Robiginitalea sp. M366]|uniref:acyltransferase family protein n=1 Tax=Robiginitalea aestuariiviva TaxID=3036903 RepID=UPI00240D6ADA|nr:heparan-alpha-glucosaminide N-acetyltransferase domain-containing protein [Robiginitalea aestuariiviva]MDG1571568.1 heparan-alpha-glucosaminide N-acetyltransferase domain-containing protein [Robiginitalea aestuariiviva]